MSSYHAVRALTVLGIVAGLGLSGPALASAAAKPKPVPLPAARSWVGGKQLIDSGELTDLPAGVPLPPKVTATSWLIADLDTRQILAGQRMHVPLAPASTLKIFTALTLAPMLNPATVYTGRPDDSAVDGTKVGIVPGSTYTVNDLLHGMIMASGNDCANALGNAAGGKAAVIPMIQAEARKLGAFDTVVHTTNGLDAPGQASSAYDLALAGSAAVAVPQLEKIMLTKQYQFPSTGKTLGKKRKRYSIQSHDKLLYNYPGAIGVKNGYTIAAEGSFVGAATRNGHTYLAVVMRAKGSTWQESASLLTWAFAHGSQARPVGTLVNPGELTAMTGPGLPAEVASTPQPTVAGSAPTSGGSGSGTSALRGAQTSLTRPAASSHTGQLLLAGVAIVLLLVVFVAGWRPMSNRLGNRRSSGSAGDW